MVEESARATLIVSGRVHGVFYRASTMEQAQQLGLMGWVKNIPDGNVEVVVEGRRHAIEELITWCKSGPPAARVDEVTTRWEEPAGEFRTFKIE